MSTRHILTHQEQGVTRLNDIPLTHELVKYPVQQNLSNSSLIIAKNDLKQEVREEM